MNISEKEPQLEIITPEEKKNDKFIINELVIKKLDKYKRKAKRIVN